jgi:hypothetical protein
MHDFSMNIMNKLNPYAPPLNFISVKQQNNITYVDAWNVSNVVDQHDKQECS